MKVVVDASNVAHHVKNANGQPQMSNILAAVRALEESEDEFVIIADASLRHDIDDKETYLKLLESENVEEVPAGNDADHFILDIATREKAKILSNDKFRDYAAEFRNIASMRIPFVIEKGRLTFGKPRQPKKDKNILQHICDEIIKELTFKKWEIYTSKEGLEISPLNIAKQAIIRIDNENNAGSKLENIFSKIPMFNKIVEMVDDVEIAAPYVIFVLVHPKDYKIAVKNAGNISVTVADRLALRKSL
jgi:Zc3h12a-like Ribonuclease domain.